MMVTESSQPRYYRRIIRITAEQSPNVKFALWQIENGIEPTGEVILPGVLPWEEYRKRRLTWDRIRQCIGLDAQFWEGAENLMYPPEWLNISEQHARRLNATLKPGQRRAKAIGIDTAEGGDDTSMCAVDELGLIELVSEKTHDTSIIQGKVIAFGNKHAVSSDMWMFDRGGGGKQISDAMRRAGHHCLTVAFGEGIAQEPKRGINTLAQRVSLKETRYAYKNRRAQMYGELREVMDPTGNEHPFAIPSHYGELRRQLAPIPLQYDSEGRMYLPPKRKTGNSTERSLTEIIGRSPDDADALVIAVHCMRHGKKRPTAGVPRR